MATPTLNHSDNSLQASPAFEDCLKIPPALKSHYDDLVKMAEKPLCEHLFKHLKMALQETLAVTAAQRYLELMEEEISLRERTAECTATRQSSNV